MNIAVCGAFDIVSYGDALFPVAIDYELRRRIKTIEKIVLFAPIGIERCYSNDQKVYSYSEFEKMHNIYNFNAIIIGGGELLHFNPIYFRDKSGKEIKYESGELWSRPAQFANKMNIPYIINSVGVAETFSDEQTEIIKNSLSNASYISVRDKYSYERINECIHGCECVPDSLWNIDRYFPSVNNSKDDYIVIQHGTMFQLDKLLEVISEVKDSCRVVLLPINYCHEDRVIAEKAKAVLGDCVTVYDRLLEIKEIYDIISNSKLFIGTSLHGTITAQANGIPSIIFDMYTDTVGKMDGLYSWGAGTIKMISDMYSLKSEIYDVLERYYVNNDVINNLKKRVDCHYDKMAYYLCGGIVNNG